jgi:hypothetical protein
LTDLQWHRRGRKAYGCRSRRRFKIAAAKPARRGSGRISAALSISSGNQGTPAAKLLRNLRRGPPGLVFPFPAISGYEIL